MIRTLLFAGIAAFVGKKLYDKGTLDPYIDEARKQLKAAFPTTAMEMEEASSPPRTRSRANASLEPAVSQLPPKQPIPAG